MNNPMKITVFIIIVLLIVAAIIYFIPFDKGVVASEDAAAPFLPTFICFPKHQFNSDYKGIKNSIRDFGGILYPIPGDKVCFKIIPETYPKIKKLGLEVEVLR